MNYLLYTIIDKTFNLLQMLILIRVVLSWIPHNPYSQLMQLLYQITDVILKPIREMLPLQSAGVDFSPILVFFLLGFLKKFLLMAV
jgi:YggT family protein